MEKEIKKNDFSESTFIFWLSIIVSKLLGVAYNIPFYGIIGDAGGFLYSIAYQIYGLFLELSTSGIPTAVSITVGHYIALKKYRTKEEAYKMASRFITILSFIMFLVMFFASDPIARFYLGNMENGVTVDEISRGIKAVSICLLIVPFLSVRRGYLQGHGFFQVSSISQIIEQSARIVFALGGAYFCIHFLAKQTNSAVYVALLGASIGAILAFVYIDLIIRRNKSSFEKGTDDEEIEEKSKIMRRMADYCITITIVSIVSHLYNITDTKLMLEGLHAIGYADVDNQNISSLISSWVPKMTEIMGALATAMTASIAPNIASKYADNDQHGVNEMINKGISILALICFPMTIGMCVFAEPYFRMFYGYNKYGAPLLRISSIFNMLYCFTVVLTMALQSLGEGKKVIRITFLSIIINLIGDIPFIYLLNYLGLPAYLGPSFSSMFAELIRLCLILKIIYEKIHINYDLSKKVIRKEVIPIIGMTITILAVRYVWPPVESRVLLVPQLVLYATSGIITFGILSLNNKLIQDVFGKDIVSKVMQKIKK